MESSKFNILNRCFTKSWINSCVNNNNPTYDEIVRRFIDYDSSKTNKEIISDIYDLMQKKYRNEYIYKNAILNKILLQRHNYNNSIALSEFPIAKSIADMIVINGKGIVYEIKTELDNFNRLENQINDYYKAFSYVYVVTYKKNVPILEKKINDINPKIGILIYNKVSFTEYKKAIEETRFLDFEVIFKMLRKKEFEKVILDLDYELPNCSQFYYYEECKKLFSQAPIIKLQKVALQILKERNKISKDFMDELPYEMRFLCYILNTNQKDLNSIQKFLNKKYVGE